MKEIDFSLVIQNLWKKTEMFQSLNLKCFWNWEKNLYCDISFVFYQLILIFVSAQEKYLNDFHAKKEEIFKIEHKKKKEKFGIFSKYQYYFYFFKIYIIYLFYNIKLYLLVMHLDLPYLRYYILISLQPHHIDIHTGIMFQS